MEDTYFMVRISSRTFEYYSGIGYRDEGGAPEEFAPVGKTRGHWRIYFHSYILDESGKPIGCKFENAEDGSLHDVYPGKVYSIPVWVTAVDDDGCPEDVCIDHYVQLLPWANSPAAGGQ